MPAGRGSVAVLGGQAECPPLSSAQAGPAAASSLAAASVAVQNIPTLNVHMFSIVIIIPVVVLWGDGSGGRPNWV